MNFIGENISAENILFRGKFIKFLESSIVSSGRFVPFSNTFNILLFKVTDNLTYFVFLRISIIFLNFYILKKIFDYLKISKYFIYAVIGICYNHAFLNGQYITSFEGDISLLISIFFYIDLKRSNRKTNIHEYFLIIFLMIFLLGLKESMFGFFAMYTFLKIFFFKNDNLLIKFSYLIILVIYLCLYYNFTFINIDINHIYGLKDNETIILLKIAKILLNYIICFPLLFFLIIFIFNNLIRNYFVKKIKSLSIKDIYFISCFGYLAVYIILDLFAFRYILPLYFILLPLFFIVYDKLNKKKLINIFIIIIFIFGPGYSNTVELVNNLIHKKNNTALDDKLNKLSKFKKIAIVHNIESEKYLLANQKHDRNEFGNMLLYFEDNKDLEINLFFINSKNINKEFLNNEVIISIIKEDIDLHKFIMQHIGDKSYNKSTYKYVCFDPIFIKNLIRQNDCVNLITTINTKI